MIETPLHTEREEQSPFQEEIVLDNYFATENAEKILRSVNQAIADGVRLVVLSGDEGSGKTMLCHKLDSDPQQTCKTVFFPRTVDSFEDVVRIVALGLGLDPQVGGDARTIDEVLEEISTSLISVGEPLLLIFDEAENIYLATLERIRKMLDRLSGSGAHIHVLFSGRTTFLENCQQLSMCDFQNKEEHHVLIEPLTEIETADYLFHSCSKLVDVECGMIFTPEVVRNIYHVGGGNFRMTNILAEEAVQKDGDNTSFMVLLENVKEDAVESGESRGLGMFLKNYADQYRAYIPHTSIGVGIVLLCILFLFGGDGEQDEMQAEIPVIEKVDDSPTIKPELETSNAEPEVVIDIPKQVITPQTEMGTQIEEVKEPVVVEEKGESPLPEVEIDVQQQTEFSSPALEKSEGMNEVTSETAEGVPPVLLTSKVVNKTKEPIEHVEIVELLRDSSSKRRPGRLPKTTRVTIKEQAVKEKPRNEVREVIASNAHFTVEQLYKKRLMAGTSWYNNKKNHKYTVQVMVLTSETAEGNLKKMLQEDRYRQEAGNFYIFKKLSTSDTLFVFYGEYDTIAQARLAQNSLPQFLRKHKPYAISVKGAMSKVRR
jgi:type II secretory pathway predicted ATPase ExeA/septal ring-binding cell division protein DamX